MNKCRDRRAFDNHWPCRLRERERVVCHCTANHIPSSVWSSNSWRTCGASVWTHQAPTHDSVTRMSWWCHGVTWHMTLLDLTQRKHEWSSLSEHRFTSRWLTTLTLLMQAAETCGAKKWEQQKLKTAVPLTATWGMLTCPTVKRVYSLERNTVCVSAADFFLHESCTQWIPIWFTCVNSMEA